MSAANMETIMSSVNLRVFKEPRGAMKLLQFVFGICAFATTTSFSTTIAIEMTCPGGTTMTVTETIQYSFQIDHIRNPQPACNETLILEMKGDFSSDAGFFVAVGVMAFLYVIGALVFYVLFSPIYTNNPLLPLADCGIHFVLTVLWLASSSAWANSLTAIKVATAYDTLLTYDNLNEICSKSIHNYNCTLKEDANYSKLVISIILGFLCMFLWACNLWFIFKETAFFKERQQKEVPSTTPVQA